MIRYATRTRSDRIAAQEKEHSCGAACVRQLLSDNGIEVSEAEVRKHAGYVDKPLHVGDLKEALCKVDAARYAAGVLDVDPSAFRRFFEEVVAIVLLRRHYVIVDGVSTDSIVRVRDPDPYADGEIVGTEATLKWDHFMELWKSGDYQLV